MNPPTQSPRVRLHMKTNSHVSTSDGFPASQGRRLMQMIFHSNNEPKEPTREAMVLTSPMEIAEDTRSEDEVGNRTIGTLKRRLFPSRKRRHPVRIPPLVFSPIHAEGGGNNHVEGTDIDEKTVHELPVSSTVEDNDDRDIDDDLLEAIEEADRLQSASSDETLALMNHTIEELHRWKAQQAPAMESALQAMQAMDTAESSGSTLSIRDEAFEAALMEQVHYNQRVAEAARAKLLQTLKETEASMKRNENDPVIRVLLEAERDVAKNDPNDPASASLTLSKLQNEVFDLGIKELNAKLQASWLPELEGADDELDMQLFDVQAFASDLDNVLAQFDAVGSRHLMYEAGENTAGQMAQEH